MRALLQSWGRASIAGAPALPTPADLPIASIAGPDPDRVLVIGGGPAAGAGTASHADALPGRLARALQARTARGAVVEARGAHLALLEDLPALLATAQLQRFDVLVVFVGLEDGVTGIPLRRWRHGLLDLIDTLRRDGARDALILLMRIPPASTVPIYSGPRLLLADRHIARLNRALERIAHARDDVILGALPPAQSDGRPGTTTWYDRCGRALAEHLAPHLDAHAEAIKA